jgi:hypothetical protein
MKSLTSSGISVDGIMFKHAINESNKLSVIINKSGNFFPLP